MSNDNHDLTQLLGDLGLSLHGVTMQPLVIAISNQGEYGLLFAGRLEAEHEGIEPLAVSTIRALRRHGVELADGDCLFFPNAAPGHRVMEVEGDGVSRIHGWST